ncbi:unnamed protein product, partial [Closterium sp. NIES-53]
MYSPGMTRLTHLDLSYNFIDGQIAGTVDNLHNLRYLDIHRTNLTGPLPRTLGTFSSLTYLNISQTGLTCPADNSDCGYTQIIKSNAFCQLCSSFCNTC